MFVVKIMSMQETKQDWNLIGYSMHNIALTTISKLFPKPQNKQEMSKL